MRARGCVLCRWGCQPRTFLRRFPALCGAFRRFPALMFCRQACGFLDLANIFVDRHVGFLPRPKKPTCLCRKNNRASKNPHSCPEKIICVTAEVAKPTHLCRKVSSEGCSVDRRVGFQMSEDFFVDRHVGFLTWRIFLLTGMWVFYRAPKNPHACAEKIIAPQKTHVPVQKKSEVWGC